MSGPLAAGLNGHSPGLRVVDSITDLDLPGARGVAARGAARVAVAGSHGGEYSGRFALSAGLSAVIFHDAGLGLDAAGVAGLALLDRSGVAARSRGSASAPATMCGCWTRPRPPGRRRTAPSC